MKHMHKIKIQTEIIFKNNKILELKDIITILENSPEKFNNRIGQLELKIQEMNLSYLK